MKPNTKVQHTKEKFCLIASDSKSLLNFRSEFMQEIQSRKFEVHVISPGLEKGTPINSQFRQMGLFPHNINLRRAGKNPFKDLKDIFGLYLLIKRIRPDYLITYNIKPVIYGNICARILGVPKIYSMITGLGFAFQGGTGSRLILKILVSFLYRVALKAVDKVFFQNPDNKNLFIKLKIIKNHPQKISIVNGSGVNLIRFCETHLPKEPKFILISRLLGDKGIREYVEAAKIVRAHYPNTEFGLAGPFDENPDSITPQELESWINSNHIHFLGSLDDVRPSISNYSILVLPSYGEGTPRIVLEAMAMGRPVITTDVPGCRETVTNKKNGFLVEVKDVKSLVEAMLKFIEEPDLISSFGRESRFLAESKYDVDEVNKIMIDEIGIK